MSHFLAKRSFSVLPLVIATCVAAQAHATPPATAADGARAQPRSAETSAGERLASAVSAAHGARFEARYRARVALARELSRASRTDIQGLLPRLSPAEKVEFLRAFAPRAGEMPDLIADTLDTTALAATDLGTRLTLVPAAYEIAASDRPGHERGRKWLDAFTEAAHPWPLRAEALASLIRLGSAEAFRRGLEDASPRVRAAALRGFSARLRDGRTGESLWLTRACERLEKDTWPLVRVAAIEALAEAPRAHGCGAGLVRALSDSSPWLRENALLSMSRPLLEGDPALTQEIASLAKSSRSPHTQRLAALGALGRSCRPEHGEYLVTLARTANSATTVEGAELARSAIEAAAAIGVPGLREKLAPLLEPRSSPALRRLVTRALTEPSRCTPMGAPDRDRKGP